MPMKPPRIGVSAPRDPWPSRPAITRIRGRRLQRFRQQLFARQPLCVACEQAGRVTLAIVRDHIVPLAEGGTDDPSNTQALCQACSDRKTQAEAARGTRRAHRGDRKC